MNTDDTAPFPRCARPDDDYQIDAMRYTLPPPLTPTGYPRAHSAQRIVMPPAYLNADAIRERLAAEFDADAPIMVLPPSTFEMFGRTLRESMQAAGRWLAELYRTLEPAMREIAKLAKHLGRLEYECREELRQHRRNPTRVSLMRGAYRARRRGRW